MVAFMFAVVFDNFAKMMLGTVASNNTSASAASAFEQKMRDAAASYNAMRQVEAELKKDDEKFQVALSGLRRELDTTSRALSSAQSPSGRSSRFVSASTSPSATISLYGSDACATTA